MIVLYEIAEVAGDEVWLLPTPGIPSSEWGNRALHCFALWNLLNEERKHPLQPRVTP